MQNTFNELLNEIKVAKSNYNSFGKYHFRSNEDIQTALKPLLLKYGFSLKSEMTIQELAGDVWLGIKYEMIDTEKNIVGNSSAFVAVDVNKKGMDKAQATGAALSYLQKYGLAQLLMLDDTKDADSMDNSTPSPKKGSTYTMTELKQLVATKKMTSAQANAYVKQHNIK